MAHREGGAMSDFGFYIVESVCIIRIPCPTKCGELADCLSDLGLIYDCHQDYWSGHLTENQIEAVLPLLWARGGVLALLPPRGQLH